MDNELDELRQGIREIKETLAVMMTKAGEGSVYKMSGEEHVQTILGMHDDPNIVASLNAILDWLKDACNMRPGAAAG